MAAEVEKWVKWEQIRAKGRRRFVFLYGVLGYGMISAVAFASMLAMDLGWQRFPILVLTGLPVWTAAGYVFGFWKWQRVEWLRQQQLVRDHGADVSDTGADVSDTSCDQDATV